MDSLGSQTSDNLVKSRLISDFPGDKMGWGSEYKLKIEKRS
jgi:hypothetical protein